MKHIALVLFFCITTTVFSQENNMKHTVVKGETIYQIAKKYNVKQEAIFKLNPEAKNKLKLNSVLLIPKTDVVLEEKAQTITHEVLPKQTLYGISKQYKVSIDAIKNANSIIEKEGLEIGLQLVIPVDKNYKPEKIKIAKPLEVTPPVVKQKKAPVSRKNWITHIVFPEETKYGIAKRYKITVEELEKENPEVVNGLTVGATLYIKKEDSTDDATDEAIIEENQPEEKDAIPGEKSVFSHDELVDNLIATASEKLGTRYRSGGTTKAGFDCSGLMINTFSAYDIKLPRSSNEMSRFGTTIDVADAQKGDLIFYTTNGTGNVNHVGMIIEITGDEIKFIHSSVHAGVIISSSKEPYYVKRFVKINRVVE
jgi:cell wall-associated NlpC family hydrolase